MPRDLHHGLLENVDAGDDAPRRGRAGTGATQPSGPCSSKRWTRCSPTVILSSFLPTGGGWQVTLLPGAGSRASGPRPDRVSSHLVDEGPGRHTRWKRRAGWALQQLAGGWMRKAAVVAGLREGPLPPPVRFTPNGSSAREATPSWYYCRPVRSALWPSTRPIVSASGDTTSGPSIVSSDVCANCCLASACMPIPRRPRRGSGTISPRRLP